MLEGNANITSDKYNSKKAGNADWYFNALAGLRINLGKSHTKTEPVKEAPVPVQEYVKPEPKPQPKVEENDTPVVASEYADMLVASVDDYVNIRA